MFDIVCIFSTGGVILWMKAFYKVGVEVINSLVKDVLIQEKASLQYYRHNNCIVKWKISELGFVFAVAYQEILNLLNVDDFLDMLVRDFTTKIAHSLIFQNGIYTIIPTYEEYFRPLMLQWEKKFKEETNIMRKEFKDTPKGKEITESKTQSMISKSEVTKKEMLEKKFQKHQKSQVKPKSTKSPKKEKTEWDTVDKVSSKDFSKIDHSQSKERSLEELRETYLSGSDKVEGFISDEEKDEEVEGGFLSSLTNKIKSITGNKILTDDDIESVFKSLITQLQSKNVAHDVIMSITTSLKNSLLSQKTASFTSVKTTVRDAVKSAMSRILTPKQ